MLLNIISRIDAKNTPVSKMIPKGEPLTNTLIEWQCDKYEEPNQDMAWEDGRDVDSFGNASPDRALVRTYAGKVLDSAGVSDLAEEVSDVAGLSKGELAESIMKKLKRLDRAIESFLCCDLNHQAGAAGVPYRPRGLGSWISSSAQGGVEDVPEAFRTPIGSINTTPVLSLTEANVNDVLQSVWEQTGQVEEMRLAAGATLRRQFTSFVTRVSASTNSAIQIRAYNSNFNGVMDGVVTQYNGDFGMLDIVPTQYNAHPNFNGSLTLARLRGYVLPTSLMKMSVKRLPRVKLLEDRGGGPRFLVDWVGGWWALNPTGMGKFAATTA